MNVLDVLLIAAAVTAVIGGWSLGLVRRVASWLGIIIGLLLALWLLPFFNDSGATADSAGFLVAACTVFVAVVLGNAVGAAIGRRMSAGIGESRLGVLDSTGGAIIGLCGLVFLVWVVVPPMADISGWPARAARGSRVAAEVDALLGTPPDVLGGLSEALGVESVPQVFNRLDAGPSEVSPPPEGLPVSPGVLSSVELSTGRIETVACGRLQSGSGFMTEGGWVVTNAHVVAGGSEIEIVSLDGRRHNAELALMDTDTDVALLRTSTFDPPELRLAEGEVGDEGVVLGYPGGGPLDRSPFVIDQEIIAVGRDLLDRDNVERNVYVLGADMAAGDSGGALVDTEGSVVGVAFAVAPDRDSVGYALTVDELEGVLETATPESVADSGGCLG